MASAPQCSSLKESAQFSGLSDILLQSVVGKIQKTQLRVSKAVVLDVLGKLTKQEKSNFSFLPVVLWILGLVRVLVHIYFL